MVVAAAMAAALFLISRRLGIVAAVAAAVMGLSGLHVGAWITPPDPADLTGRDCPERGYGRQVAG